MFSVQSNQLAVGVRVVVCYVARRQTQGWPNFLVTDQNLNHFWSFQTFFPSIFPSWRVKIKKKWSRELNIKKSYEEELNIDKLTEKIKNLTVLKIKKVTNEG